MCNIVFLCVSDLWKKLFFTSCSTVSDTLTFNSETICSWSRLSSLKVPDRCSLWVQSLWWKYRSSDVILSVGWKQMMCYRHAATGSLHIMCLIFRRAYLPNSSLFSSHFQNVRKRVSLFLDVYYLWVLHDNSFYSFMSQWRVRTLWSAISSSPSTTKTWKWRSCFWICWF